MNFLNKLGDDTELNEKGETAPFFGPRNYYNRELSWLKFNFRVFQEGIRKSNLLLERLKYLAIVANNLDEFFEIRVAGLEQKLMSEIYETKADSLTPRRTLKRIYRFVGYLMKRLYSAWNEEIIPQLRDEGYHLYGSKDFTDTQKEYVKNYFHEKLYPVLTPIKIDVQHPFPWVLNKTLSVAVLLKHENNDGLQMGVVSIPRLLPRIIKLPSDGPGVCFAFITSVMEIYLDKLFKGYSVLDSSPFRITRNSNLYLSEEDESDLLRAIEKELMNSKRGDVVRLEIRDHASVPLVEGLRKLFKLRKDQVNVVAGPVNFNRVMALYEMIDRNDLKFVPIVPSDPKWSDDSSIFSKIKKEDILFHHPYESFQPILDFLQAASEDPSVISIKITLYRMGDDSPIIQSLLRAAANGKDVSVVMELMARFDEQSNVTWARHLQDNGVHVIYGFPGKKTHCKMILVVREEGNGLKKYVHIGTGNYNEVTARIYTDLSLFTVNEKITNDVMEVFNVLSSQSKNPEFSEILVSPFNMIEKFQELIMNEISAAKSGKKARIIIKMNALQEEFLIRSLYCASMAGVQVTGIVRGICCLKAGRKVYSKNIEIKSIIGRFLEHSRIYYFENGSPYRLYIGSADWMSRNLRRRVEVAVPILDKKLEERILNEILGFQLRDNMDARIMGKAWNPPDPEILRNSSDYFSSQREFFNMHSRSKK